MRTIKFRVYDLLEKAFIPEKDFHLITIRFDGLPQFFTCDNVSVYQKFWPEHLVLQQFTGLLDRDSKEIYEGDIVSYGVSIAGKYARSFAPVVFSPFGYGFVLDSSGRHKIGGTEYGDYVPLRHSEMTNMTYEVVGNIFENKDYEQ